MAKKKVTELIAELLENFLPENGLELYNSEFVKEGKDWYLRIYIDKEGEGDAQYISTDECELVSRFLSDELDRLDPIEQNYYLEVSSPGMDRELIKERDFERFKGSTVDVSLYKAFGGRKAYQGELVGIVNGLIVINDETGTRLEFPKEQVAKTKLAVIF